MQIHEIARRNINEGPLKGVATNIAKGAVNTVKPVVNYAVDQAKGVAKLPLNTAEYFANKILDTAGVPAAQQGQYSKYGQIAAGQNKGTASIAKTENEIATEIAKEWARLGTLNGQRVELPLDPKQIALAAGKLNTQKLQINTNNIVKQVTDMAPEQRRLLDLYKRDTAPTPPTPPIPVPTPPTPPIPVPTPPRPAPPTPIPTPAGFNYADVMKMPSMNQPVKKLAPAMAESLTWSKNFDPSKELYRRMKQGQTQ
jgi:hypothetical protein